jgi:hypothetical protein
MGSASCNQIRIVLIACHIEDGGATQIAQVAIEEEG